MSFAKCYDKNLVFHIPGRENKQGIIILDDRASGSDD